MAARIRIAVACAMSALALVACGSSDDKKAERPLLPGAGQGGGPVVGAGEANDPVPPLSARVVRELNRRCCGARASTAVASAGGGRATEARRNRAALQRLRHALARARIPVAARRRLRGYQRALRAEIYLDRRIERAARARDTQSVAVGLAQNRFNRATRTRAARRLGLGRCLYGRSRS